MTMTPQEIHSKQFTTRSNKWYDKAEVTDFLDQVAVDYDQLVQENQKLRQQLTDANSNASQVEEMKQSVNSSILIAQEAADRLKKQTEAESEATLQQAQGEAQKIVMEANAKANALLTESQQQNKSLLAEKDALDKDMGAFKQRIEGLLNAQLQLLHTDDWREFQTPAADATAVSVDQTTQINTAQVAAEAPAADVDVQTVETTAAPAPSEEATADQPTEKVVIFPELEEKNENFLNKG